MCRNYSECELECCSIKHILEHQMDFLAHKSLMQEVKEPLGFGSQPHLHFLPNNAHTSRDNKYNQYIHVCLSSANMWRYSTNSTALFAVHY